MNILDRFLRYVSISTTSDSEKECTPSTKSQYDLAHVLVEELKELGLTVDFDEEHCMIYAVLKANTEAPALGFISHMDTSEDALGEDIKPKIIENYDGNDIELGNGKITKTSIFPDLKNHVGKTLITTDGSTLLGADDKAGIAEIMTMLEYFATNTDAHGDIYVAFTPDEEIGRGVENFDLKRFPADFGYTVDGSTLGEISYETFNATNFKIHIDGVHCHTGSAKGVMVNALEIACLLNSLLPNEKPENSEGREGFYCLKELSGDTSHAEMFYLVRDFDKDNHQKRKNTLLGIIASLNEKFGNFITVDIIERWENMMYHLEDDMHLIENGKKAILDAGVTPIVEPIRGGTDGGDLCALGFPCPNLGTGGHSFHSIHEYIALEDMQKVSEILIGIVKTYTQEKNINLSRKIREEKSSL